MKSIIDIEEVVSVTFKIEPLYGNTKAFEQQIKAAFRKISRSGERIYVEIGEINFDEYVSGIKYEFEGAYNYARITEIELFIEQQIEIFKTTIFA
jgi:hypothetical protein